MADDSLVVGTGFVGSLSGSELLLALLQKLVLKLHLSIMVKSIMDSFLSFSPSRLRIHKLRLIGSLLIGNLFADSLMSLSLSLLECLLVRQKLLVSSPSVTIFVVYNWLKAALLLSWIRLLKTLLIKLTLAL